MEKPYFQPEEIKNRIGVIQEYCLHSSFSTLKKLQFSIKKIDESLDMLEYGRIQLNEGNSVGMTLNEIEKNVIEYNTLKTKYLDEIDKINKPVVQAVVESIVQAMNNTNTNSNTNINVIEQKHEHEQKQNSGGMFKEPKIYQISQKDEPNPSFVRDTVFLRYLRDIHVEQNKNLNYKGLILTKEETIELIKITKESIIRNKGNSFEEFFRMFYYKIKLVVV